MSILRLIIISLISMMPLLAACDFSDTREDNPPSYTTTAFQLRSSISSVDGYGSDVALTKDRAFVTASECRHARATGSITVFTRSGGSWTEEQVIEETGGRSNFACFISATSDYFAVTAGADKLGNGGVHLYRHTLEGWELMQTINSPVNEQERHFGESLSLSSNRLAVGNRRDKVRVYRLIDSRWELESLILGDGPNDRRFGYEVSLDNDQLAIATGARGDFEYRSVYLYEFDGSEWAQIWKKERPTGSEIVMFGNSISLKDENLAIGSWGVSSDAVVSAELFSKLDGIWTSDSIALGEPIDSTGEYHGLGEMVSTHSDRIAVSESELKRIQVFEKYRDGVIAVAQIDGPMEALSAFRGGIELRDSELIAGDHFAGQAWIYTLHSSN